MPRTAKNSIRSSIIASRREDLLTIKEWAAMTREHPESVRRRCRKRNQPGAVRSGGHWRIDAAVALQAMRADSKIVVLPESVFGLVLQLVQPVGAHVDEGRDLLIMARNPNRH